MHAVKLCSMLLFSLLVAGCVSLSKYNDRLEQISNLNLDIASLEETLRKSESARASLDSQLQEARENLAKLQEEHEALEAASMTVPEGTERVSMDAQKQDFADELTLLTAKLADADARIRELSAALAAKEEAVKKMPVLEAALAEREQRIRDLTEYLRNQETKVTQLQKDAVDLTRKRNGSEEKTDAVAAIRSNLSKEIEKGEIAVKEYRDKLIVSMKEQVLFDSGSARITKSGQKTLNRMAKVLKKIRNNRIIVEGHTDTMPIRNRSIVAKYPTNWDLAAARATNVLKHLENKGKIKPELLALAGYGCYLPAAANDCEKNRKLNRRIEIAVVPAPTDRVAVAGEATKATAAF